ncbi:MULTISPECIES: hypothetical protein [Streptomyces]|uniref:Uncharacterized protein n=1 Tax=Streptomyces flavovirens TaxID=52258 RepID=A0ABV8NBL2_9ACTN|nr:hypothetical protein [Streptomyces sp. MBT51]MBK3596061.1 hypothetical protein [Streptomyces sp. MBT51]
MATAENEGTSSGFTRHVGPGQPAGLDAPHADPGPLLTSHATLVLVVAGFVGAIAGGLTYLSAGNTAAAVLAGLTGWGVSAPVLHKLIGP